MSTDTTAKYVGDTLILKNVSNTITVNSSVGLSSTTNFIFPPNEGGSGQYLRGDGSGISGWADSNQILIDDGAQGTVGSTGPTYFPPTPLGDSINVLTNSAILIDFFANSTLGGSITSPNVPIASVTILRTPNRGTLTATATPGQYIYQSYPRFKGYDRIQYSVTDTLGVTSKINGLILLNVTDIPPPMANTTTGDVGVWHTYGTSNNQLRYYKDGTDVLLKQLTPGSSLDSDGPPYLNGTLDISGINSNATSRLDNVMYFTNTEIGLAASVKGRLYGWDYVNDIVFLVADFVNDSTSISKFDPSWYSDMSRGGASFANKSLYLGPSDNQTNIYYRVTLGPYNPNASGRKQSVTQVIQVNFGYSVNYGDLSYEPFGKNIALCGQNTTSGDNTKPGSTAGDHNVLVDPLTGFVKLYQGTELPSSSQIGINPDGVFTFTQGNTIYSRNFNGSSITTGNRTTVATSATGSQADIGGWINEL
jgi:hypothetical protein